MSTQSRLAAAAFFTDMGLYFLMLSLPFRALDLKASSLQLGIVPLLYAAPYSLVALTAGRLSDRWPRRRAIAAGCIVAALTALCLAWVKSLTFIFLTVPFLGIGLGFFWPSLQAAFSEIDQGKDLHSFVALFNLSWSSGKALGLLLGGLLFPWIGASGLSLIAALCFLAAAFSLPWMPRPGVHEEISTIKKLPTAHDKKSFLYAAWIANGITFGVVATMNHHFPKRILQLGMDSTTFGVFLSMVFFTQGIFFFSGRKWIWWHYRKLPFVLCQLVLAALIMIIPSANEAWKLWFLAPPLGICLAFAYQSSIYYSLHSSEGRGKQAGIHEASLGIFSATIPVLGGWAAGSSRLLAPFHLAAIAVLLSAFLSSILFIRSARR